MVPTTTHPYKQKSICQYTQDNYCHTCGYDIAKIILVQTANRRTLSIMVQLKLTIDWGELTSIVFTTKVLLLPDRVGGLSKIIIKLILLKTYEIRISLFPCVIISVVVVLLIKIYRMQQYCNKIPSKQLQTQKYQEHIDRQKTTTRTTNFKEKDNAKGG